MMEQNSVKYLVVTGVSFVLGVVLLALCYNLFLLPNDLVVSGMSGLGIALEDLCHINATAFIYIANIILLFVSFIFLGYEKTKNTIIGSLLYPIMITFTAPIAQYILKNYPITDTLVLTLFASLLYGISNGLIYKCGYTTGGNDVLMQLLNKYFKIPESKALAIVNLLVIILGAITFGYMKGIYSLFILLLSTFFIDKIMLGIADSKLFYIYTKEEKKIKKLILNEIKSGFTILPTKGGYSHNNGSLIMCVVPNRYYYILKEKILEIDPDAFFIVDTCYEVNGGVVQKKSLL